MSQQHENSEHADNLPDDGKQALSALRNIWSAQQQTSADIDEACGNTKSCKNMSSVGFHGMIDEVGAPTSGNTSVGSDLRAAWKTKLEREGKMPVEGNSVRDLIFGSAKEPKQ